jgi:hypothetical protein
MSTFAGSAGHSRSTTTSSANGCDGPAMTPVAVATHQLRGPGLPGRRPPHGGDRLRPATVPGPGQDRPGRARGLPRLDGSRLRGPDPEVPGDVASGVGHPARGGRAGVRDRTVPAGRPAWARAATLSLGLAAASLRLRSGGRAVPAGATARPGPALRTARPGVPRAPRSSGSPEAGEARSIGSCRGSPRPTSGVHGAAARPHARADAALKPRRRRSWPGAPRVRWSCCRWRRIRPRLRRWNGRFGPWRRRAGSTRRPAGGS